MKNRSVKGAREETGSFYAVCRGLKVSACVLIVLIYESRTDGGAVYLV